MINLASYESQDLQETTRIKSYKSVVNHLQSIRQTGRYCTTLEKAGDLIFFSEKYNGIINFALLESQEVERGHIKSYRLV